MDMGRDLSMMNRGTVKKDKKMYDSTGTMRYVPFKKWEREVVNNPQGPTAQRAKKEKDPDLKKISVDVIQIRHGGKDMGPIKTPIPGVEEKGTRRDLRGTTLDKETAKRMGFRRAEEGKHALTPSGERTTLEVLKEEKKKDAGKKTS